ncbi:lysine--tRNA ligase, partial [Patescibacteria group bacterium]|nr:lysine--tRNA ligase [Patescibacteria group bacterium]
MPEKAEFLKNRKEKLEKLKDKKINPFPSISKRDTSCLTAAKKFDNLKDKTIVLAGRVKLLRLHGGSCFINLYDGSGVFQLFVSKKEVGPEKYQELKLYDVGDILEASGTLFKTKKGEKTLMVDSFALLTKSLRPLPEKWHGL